LAAGASETGVTIHFVDNGVDTGKPIVQQHVAIAPDDDETKLHERIKVVERDLLVQTVGKIADGSLQLVR